MKLIIASIVFCFSALPAYSQIKELQIVQSARTHAKNYRQKMVWDSACIAYKSVIASSKYANPYDHLDYAYCSLKVSDTARFISYLEQAIAEGVDTAVIHSYFRKTNEDERSRVDIFVQQNFDRLHHSFLASYDSAAVYELDGIHEMDQLVRTPIGKILARNHAAWTTDSNIQYLTLLASYADSINYNRIMRLFASGRFPGYHRCGAAAASLGLAIMHFDHPYEEWERVFALLKKAVQDGDIDPDQVAGIVDRHYLGASNPAYYYGRLRWGAAHPFYDCARVDKFRAEIGLENLKSEYARAKLELPECYKGN